MLRFQLIPAVTVQGITVASKPELLRTIINQWVIAWCGVMRVMSMILLFLLTTYTPVSLVIDYIYIYIPLLLAVHYEHYCFASFSLNGRSISIASVLDGHYGKILGC